MDSLAKSILLIVPEFPPNDSIGGRRWAKFAKYLAKNNVYVKVIAFEPDENKNNTNWLNDIQSTFIEVFYIPSSYPSILKSTSKNILIRGLKKIATKIIGLYDGGIIQDKSIFFKSALLKKASEILVKHKIKNVVCSCPPHRASYYTALLKDSISNLNLVVDFRDRWTDGAVYGLEKVTDSSYKKEWELQKYTCEHADIILSTYHPILDELQIEYPHISKEKFILFPHSFDKDDYDFKMNEAIVDNTEKKIQLLFGGTINTSAYNDAVLPFLEGLVKLKQMNPEYYSLLQVTIHSENYKVGEAIHKMNIADVVSISPKISERNFYQKAKESDFLILFMGNHWKNLISTKCITYLPFRKPILLLSDQGLVSDWVVSNKLGYHISAVEVSDNLTKLVQDYKNKTIPFNYQFDYSQYSYEVAVKKLMEILKID